jgi:hypothetical protein
VKQHAEISVCARLSAYLEVQVTVKEKFSVKIDFYIGICIF